jgi:proteasome lid subunit RPN8/RPN11
MIKIDEKLIDKIKRHAEEDYPHECGGMLIGRFLVGGKKEVIETFPLENAREDSRHNRVLLLPQDVLRAERHARENKLDVVGYYHSHPNAPAVPSQYDLDHALPVWSYVIASVVDGITVEVRSWEMEDDRSKFNEEAIDAAIDAEGSSTARSTAN